MRRNYAKLCAYTERNASHCDSHTTRPLPSERCPCMHGALTHTHSCAKSRSCHPCAGVQARLRALRHGPTSASPTPHVQRAAQDKQQRTRSSQQPSAGAGDSGAAPPPNAPDLPASRAQARQTKSAPEAHCRSGGEQTACAERTAPHHTPSWPLPAPQALPGRGPLSRARALRCARALGAERVHPALSTGALPMVRRPITLPDRPPLRPRAPRTRPARPCARRASWPETRSAARAAP